MSDPNKITFTGSLLPRDAAEEGQPVTPPLAGRLTRKQVELLFQMTLGQRVTRVLYFLMPNEAPALLAEAFEKLLETDIITQLIDGTTPTYQLIYEQLVALGVIPDQKLGEKAMAYLNTSDPIKERYDPTLTEPPAVEVDVLLYALDKPGASVLVPLRDTDYVIEGVITYTLEIPYKYGEFTQHTINARALFTTDDIQVAELDERGVVIERVHQQVSADLVGIIRNDLSPLRNALGPLDQRALRVVDFTAFRITTVNGGILPV